MPSAPGSHLHLPILVQEIPNGHDIIVIAELNEDDVISTWLNLVPHNIDLTAKEDWGSSKKSSTGSNQFCEIAVIPVISVFRSVITVQNLFLPDSNILYCNGLAQ